jgi:hypothetical protein
MTAEPYERIADLCEALMTTDGLSATLQSLLEAAPAVGDSQTAESLADEISAAREQLGDVKDKDTVRDRLADLIDALREVARGAIP